MFVKITSPDNTVVAINRNKVRAIYKVSDKRCNIAFDGAERTLAVNMGLDDVLTLLEPKQTSNRARKTTQ